MTKREVEALVAEIHRYLEAVDTFRAQGREPRWRPEWAAAGGAAVDRIRPRARKRRGATKPREV